jgi:glutamate-ammonia-ligase adenylyltransferase
MTIRGTAEANVKSSALAARFVDGPHVSAPDKAEQRVRDWLAELLPVQAAAIDELLAQFPRARAILLGIAEASPYLFDLVRADAARALRVLECEPELHLAQLIEQTRSEVSAATHEADVMQKLRRTKSEAALLIALCDIGGVWPVMRVTAGLTDLAVASVQSALRFLLQQEAMRGRITPPNPDRPEDGSGLIVLAMGKMGAGELNFSSDIDLIVFFDAAASTLAPDIEPQPFYVRVTQALSRLLQQRSGDGYVFRVDLRLRPDPASTAVAISTASALHYYEREGRTWERAAMIKARPCAGDLSAGHNVKVGRGGIREIEFFAQTQQLIAGGRHPELRARPTLEALNVLASSHWITFAARDELTAAYEFLRRVEHRLQMMADEQTHALPDDNEAVERFAGFLGYESRAAFARDLLGHLNVVQGHYAKLFEGDPAGTAKLPDVDYTAGPDDQRLTEHLASLGFKKPIMVAQTARQWLDGDYRVFRMQSTRSAFVEFLPSLIAGLANAEQPDNAVVVFDHFLQALQRGERLFLLLSQNRDLVALVALILGAAPRLGDMLARQPQIMDGLIDPRFFGAMPDQKELSARLAATLKDADSYEDFLDRLRLFGQESLFLIGTRILSGTVSAQQASVAFADVAEGIVHTVHGLVTDQFAAQYGRIKGQQTAILAMGRLGSREMTAASDLDLILLYEFDPEYPDSDGAKSLHGAQYFARFTQRLISAFTTRTNYGVLYEVDMRLRPSGRAGPVASHVDSFAEYQDREAWTWEHMALTRARVISASPDFRKVIEEIIRQVLTRPRDAGSVAKNVADMRRAIALEKGEDDIWDLKYAAGGTVDIDFIAQYLQLVHAADKPDILDVSTLHVLDKAARLGVLPQSSAEVLRSAVRLYHDLTQILRLCVSEGFNPETAGEDLLRIMARAGDAPDFSSLQARVKETQAEVRQVFRALIEHRAANR